MGWLRLVGSLKWQVSFAKEPYKRDYIQITARIHTTCLCLHPSENEVSLQEIRSGFEFVLGLFGIVLRGGYLYGAWPRTVLILIEFKFIVPELRQLVVFCTCWILSEGLKCVENFSYGDIIILLWCTNIHRNFCVNFWALLPRPTFWCLWER